MSVNSSLIGSSFVINYLITKDGNAVKSDDGIKVCYKNCSFMRVDNKLHNPRWYPMFDFREFAVMPWLPCKLTKKESDRLGKYYPRH